MNEAMKNILTRRSVRSFTEQAIPRETLEQIAQAAIQAPSAMNRQVAQFTVVTDREKIGRLAAAMAKALGRDGYDFYKPAALILCTAPRDSVLGRDDCACSMQNIMLAAHALGVGSVWINQVRDVCDEPGVRAILTEFGVPADHISHGSAALGYAAAEPAPMHKREDAIVWA